MSTSSLYIVYKTKVKEIAEYKNSWHTGPPIWNYCWGTWAEPQVDKMFPMWKGDAPNRLEQAMKEETANKYYESILPRVKSWRLVFNWTWYSNTIVPINKRHLLTNAIRVCLLDMQGELAKFRWLDILRDLSIAWPEFKDKRVLGVGLGCTSVGDPWMEYSAKSKLWDITKVKSKKRAELTSTSAKAFGI